METHYIEKPESDIKKLYPFMFPKKLKMQARVICAKRDITLAKFVRESIEKNIKNYNKIFIEK